MGLIQQIREKTNVAIIDRWGQMNAQELADRQSKEERAVIFSGHRFTKISLERYSELLAASTVEHLGSFGLSGTFAYNPDASLAASRDIRDPYPYDAVVLVLDRVSSAEV